MAVGRDYEVLAREQDFPGSAAVGATCELR
jgi:hypothetical protein